MKKGCFITTIVALTIIVAAILYVFQNHFDSLILNPGKKFVAGFIKDDIKSKIKFVADSPEKTELINLIEDYASDKKVLEKVKEADINKIISAIETAAEDSLIGKAELENISQLLKARLK
jgi:hypothetical protein